VCPVAKFYSMHWRKRWGRWGLASLRLWSGKPTPIVPLKIVTFATYHPNTFKEHSSKIKSVYGAVFVKNDVFKLETKIYYMF